MKYSNEFINQLIESEIEFSNHLASIYHYPDNITHLLYIMIPAFILKYGTNFKQLLEKCFATVPIIIDDQQDQIYQAYYFSKLERKQEIRVVKGIVLKNYKNIGLMQLLDNLVHEFNHAVNSLQNEMIENHHFLVRTGIVYHYFDKTTLQLVKTGEEEILEEVINTKQTEMIIDIIKQLSNYSISNSTVQSTLYSIDSNYHSNSYFLESYVCKKLMENKTFLSTLEVLRFEGQIEDIYHFFDSIVGQDGSFLKLSNYLRQSLKLQRELTNTKWFKKRKINRIKEINQKAFAIIQKFDSNTIYK